MRRGRPDPERLRPGDTLDCWRVESIQRGERLRLAAEMKLPVRAWLEFEVRPDGTGMRLRQKAMFGGGCSRVAMSARLSCSADTATQRRGYN
jgi:hypothetical protein